MPRRLLQAADRPGVLFVVFFGLLIVAVATRPLPAYRVRAAARRAVRVPRAGCAGRPRRRCGSHGRRVSRTGRPAPAFSAYHPLAGRYGGRRRPLRAGRPGVLLATPRGSGSATWSPGRSRARSPGGRRRLANQPAPPCPDSDLGPVPRAEFARTEPRWVLTVDIDNEFGVISALVHPARPGARRRFPGGQRFRRSGSEGRPVGSGAGSSRPGNGWRLLRDRLDQQAAADLLRKPSAPAVLSRGEPLTATAERFRRPTRRPAAANRLDAVDAGHPDVHQGHVRPPSRAPSPPGSRSPRSPITSMSSSASRISRNPGRGPSPGRRRSEPGSRHSPSPLSGSRSATSQRPSPVGRVRAHADISLAPVLIPTSPNPSSLRSATPLFGDHKFQSLLKAVSPVRASTVGITVALCVLTHVGQRLQRQPVGEGWHHPRRQCWHGH